jgi:hypothetical protein
MNRHDVFFDNSEAQIASSMPENIANDIRRRLGPMMSEPESDADAEARYKTMRNWWWSTMH